ncbi:MAG: PilZ domain-containing protein, partial [Candidatus Omnitrophica bacterium]|nr:PilZ domain-containing protein [Candidatus Omnitrophota bacterium]
IEEEVEKITGCKVQKFVGLLSEIRRAIESYYEVVIPDIEITKQKCVPLFIETNTYKGFDRRRAIRFKASVETHFPIKELYEYTQTKDISACGLLIESKKQLRLGSYLVLELDLPREEHPFPIPLLAQIVRIASLKNGNFDIGMEFIKVFQEDLRLLIHHAHTQANKAAKEPSKGLLNKNTAA